MTEGVCTSVEAAAEEALATVQPHELSDRIGVSLCAGVASTQTRSRQSWGEQQPQQSRPASVLSLCPLLCLAGGSVCG